ncbi:hypothetical protein ABES25_06130 [Bacillus gobiensis]|uniref:hypothetical protein n=1 Tax=Bacillus gobiensis TaxID=1441095 RepID=UPI003D19FE12
MSSIDSKRLKDSMKRKFEKRYPDLLLYIDNDYISELVDGIFEIVAEELDEMLKKPFR